MINEVTSIFMPEATPLELTFIVLPGASILCVAASVDPLRAANRISGEPLYSWTITSPDGTNPETTSRLPVAVTGKFNPNARHEVIVVIAGFGASSYSKGPFIAGLAKAGRRARAVGGIEAGTWLLGHAGLLENRDATTHFEDRKDFSTAFATSNIKPDRFVVDRNIFTCGGAAPALDLMLHLIRCRQGMTLALNVSSVFAYGQLPPNTLPRQLKRHNPYVANAISIMENNVDTPLTLASITKKLSITPRTLELNFASDIGETPGQYYLGLRLAAARKMVTDTRLPMTEIAARTGFSSAATFSRAFRSRFGRAATSLRSEKSLA